MRDRPSSLFWLDLLEVPYMVGGSLASSTHGLPRLTNDIDLVAKIDAAIVDALVVELQPEFYVDAGQIRSALIRGRSVNVIHLKSGFKINVFPLSSDAFDQRQFERRRFTTSVQFGPELEFAVASPEDTILAKLRWYKLGRGSSEQQWKDILSVIAVKRDQLDAAYLADWASHLGLKDLLDRALAERHQPGAWED